MLIISSTIIGIGWLCICSIIRAEQTPSVVQTKRNHEVPANFETPDADYVRNAQGFFSTNFASKQNLARHSSAEIFMEPTFQPTQLVSDFPSFAPTEASQDYPSLSPTQEFTDLPSVMPSIMPSMIPTAVPTAMPTLADGQSRAPSHSPTAAPSTLDGGIPTAAPSESPTFSPTYDVSTMPSMMPTFAPTEGVLDFPTFAPTTLESDMPSAAPSMAPFTVPTVDDLLIPANITRIVWVHDAPVSDSRFAVVVNVSVTTTGGMVYCSEFTKASAFTSVSQIVSAGNSRLAVTSPVQIVVSDLIPSTNYVIYCTTMSVVGNNYLSLAASSAHSAAVKTSCCKDITVRSAVTSIFESAPAVDALSVSLAFRPSTTVQVALSLSDPSGATAPSIFPSSFTFTNASNALTATATIVGTAAGNFTLIATLSGSSAEEFGVTYVGRRSVLVLAADAEPPTPQLLSATFTADGSAVELLFDSRTNGAGYTSIFPCTELLSFASNRSAVCQFTNGGSVIRIYQSASSSTPFLDVDDEIILIGDTALKAYCSSGNVEKCSTWASVAATLVVVGIPSNPQPPAVIINSPNSIGACQSLLLDLTTSSGSAGRPWKSRSLTVERVGSAGDDSALVNFLTTSYRFRPPTSIPSDRLAKGVSYAFTGSFCNFLDACSSITKVVTVTTNEALTPVVAMAGASAFSVSRSGGLEMRANAFTEDCSGRISFNNLRYNWSISLVSGSSRGLDLSTLRSTSQNPSIYKLSPFTLPAGATYQVTATVVYVNSDGSMSAPSRASAQVTVVAGSIIASIRGGNRRTLKAGEKTTINAAASFDQDVQGVTGSKAGLQFSWSCTQISPVFSLNCDNTITLDASTLALEEVTITPRSDAANTISRVTVVAFDGTRSSSAFTDIAIIAEDVSTLAITTAPDKLISVPTNRRLSLDASMDIVSQCAAVWQVNDATVNLTSVALTPVQRTFNRGKDYKFGILLRSNALPQRASLTFSISCGSAVASIGITTNGAPLPGSFGIDPSSGNELQTKFSFTAEDWADSDLPITYQFAFYSATSGAFLVAQGRSQTSYAVTTLPAGPASSSGELNCSVEIYDSYDAMIVVYRTVIVNELSAADQANALNSMFGSSSDGNLDGKKATVSIASSVMNRVDCTLAPNCGDLKREKCEKVANTCGECKKNFVGEDGEANSACVPAKGNSRRLSHQELASTSCTIDADCNDAMMRCNLAQSACEYKNRTCLNNCNGHGSCFFMSSSTGAAVEDCRVVDFTCQAKCRCDNGYSGASCSLSDSDLTSKRSLRNSLVSTLQSLVGGDDVTTGALQSWSAYLDSVASNPYELSLDDMETVRRIANLTALYGKDLTADYDQMRGVLSAVDALISIAHFDYNAGGVSMSNNSAKDVIDILTSFGDLVVDSLVYGQSDVSYVFSNFRIVGTVITTSDLASKTMGVPQSSSEANFGASSSSLVLEALSNAPADALIAAVLTQVYQRSVTQDLDAFFSDPIRLKLINVGNSSQSAAELISRVQFSIRNNDAVSRAVFGDSEPMVYETNCSYGVVETTSYTCPVSGEVITHTCNGTASGTYVSYCPVIQPGCNRVSIATGDASISSTCSLVTFNSNFTTCSCELVSSGYSRRLESTQQQRMLLSQAGTKLLEDSGLVDLAAASEYIAYDFKNTFRAADDLNSKDGAKKALVIILLFVIFWSLGLLGVVLIHLRESRMIFNQQRELVSQGGDIQKEQAKHLLQSYIASIIPAVYSANETMFQKFWKEVTLHHRYLHLFVPDTRRADLYDRFYRTFKILTIETMSIFWQAVFFDLQRPTDDGSCDGYMTKESCLSDKTVLDHSQSYCKWSTEGSAGVCEYDSDNFSERALVYVIIITTVLTTALKLPVDYLLQLWICPVEKSAATIAPVGVGTENAMVSNAQKVDRSVPRSVHYAQELASKTLKDAHVVGHAQAVQVTGDGEAGVQLGADGAVYPMGSSESSVDELCQKALVQRMAMEKDAPDTKLFELQWGISRDQNVAELQKNGQAMQAFVPGAIDTLSTCVKETNATATEKSKLFPYFSRANAGLELMHTFVIDLLGRKTNSAIIFRNKFDEDFEKLRVISLPLKVFGIATIIGLNTFFIYYTLLRGVSRGMHWQYVFLQTVLIQMAIEVIIFETVECLWLHYLVPESVREDVDRAVGVLRTIVGNAATLLQSDEESKSNDQRASLSAPHYLFVSNKLAAMRPDLLESQIVLSYRNYFPGMLCKTWPHYRNAVDNSSFETSEAIVAADRARDAGVQGALSRQSQDAIHRGALFFSLVRGLASGVVYSLQSIGVLPIAVQKVLVRSFQTTVLSGITLLWYAAMDNTLYFIIVVLVIVAVAVYFTVSAFRRSRGLAEQLNPTGDVKADSKMVEDKIALQDDRFRGELLSAAAVDASAGAGPHGGDHHVGASSSAAAAVVEGDEEPAHASSHPADGGGGGMVRNLSHPNTLHPSTSTGSLGSSPERKKYFQMLSEVSGKDHNPPRASSPSAHHQEK